MRDIYDILKTYWGYEQFRDIQESIIRSVLAGNDTLALLPTGGGKSICFQVPAMAMDGLCLVVSPLIALMRDQVDNLQKHGIPAAAVVSGMRVSEMELVFNKAIHQKLKFLYVSPERLESKVFRSNLSEMKIALLAVDEAHCISQWGYDFRPPYLKIADIRTVLPKIPVIALTATATPEVVTDIQQKLQFHKRCVFQKSFKRDNLTYYVFEEEDKRGRLLNIIRKVGGSGIVYVRNRAKTQEIAEFLTVQGLKAAYYHAGMDASSRDRCQADWIKGTTPIIVATNAFGMGIDKPNCRFVVHLDIPDSLEAYFQEAGRGGRDGNRAHAVMLYHGIDKMNLETNFEKTYPPIETIRQIYDLLGNYLKIPVGSGLNAAFEFNISTFVLTYKLDAVVTFNALSILEKQGLIMMTEELNAHSKLWVKRNVATLKTFIVDNPKYEAIVDVLMRLYGGGLFSDYLYINETLLANRLKIQTEEVIIALQNMAKWDIMDYAPVNKKPHLIFTEERIPSSNVFLDREVYAARKEAARKRLTAVIQYVTTQNHCRSQRLLSYFGERDSKPCGHCDYCIKQNAKPLTQEDFDQMKECLVPFKQQDITMDELAAALSAYSKARVQIFLQWLLDNNQLIPVGEKYRLLKN
ncbi:ATP-dependent DNA helicase RecQ [Bacteroidia bacterium]|nr:ATP-dependent DNA helicase RecQ [Bacteroidia bacterium]